MGSEAVSDRLRRVRNLEAGMRHYSNVFELGPYKRLHTDYRALSRLMIERSPVTG